MREDDSEILTHDKTFDQKPGEVVRISPLIRRIVENNPSPFTFTGTCTYIVGRGEVAIIDPGLGQPEHIQAIVQALKGERIAKILVTHTHRDHAPGARALAALTGAPIMGCAPFIPSNGAQSGLDSAHDLDYAPAKILSDGESVEGPGYRLTAVATPGHASNHLCFALAEERALFSGDHVMAWSTSIVTPPDGSMGDYMASLEKLHAREDEIFWPGHGGPVKNPQNYMRALARHRRLRETAILARLKAGDRQIPEMVASIYEGLDPRLAHAAGLSVYAHLEDLVSRGLARADGPATPQAAYQIA